MNCSNSKTNTHLILLTNPMGSCLRLQVVLWIPVTVEDDHSISSGKVDTETASTSRQQEAEILQWELIIYTSCVKRWAAYNSTANIQQSKALDHNHFHPNNLETAKNRTAFQLIADHLDRIRRHAFCSCDLDPMTLTHKLNLDILTMYLHIKNEFSRSRLSKIKAIQTHTHTDRQTDATENITTLHSTVVKQTQSVLAGYSNPTIKILWHYCCCFHYYH